MRTFDFAAFALTSALLVCHASIDPSKKTGENLNFKFGNGRVLNKEQHDGSFVSVKIKDLSPKFLSFYNEATRLNLSESKRWLLWKERYDFAAVPPTPQGDSIARRLLDKSWTRYPELVKALTKGDLIGKPDPSQILESIAQILKPQNKIQITLLSYVGGFEDNAFTNVTKDGIVVAVPRESPQLTRELLMTHEFTHAVQISMGYLSGGYIRTIGAIVVSEGLATRLTQKLHPQLSEGSFIEITPGWLKLCKDHQTEILKDIRKHISSNNENDIMQYTMGKSYLGIEREAYYTGWVVVEHWLSEGKSFADIAHISEMNMPSKATEAVDEILKYGH